MAKASPKASTAPAADTRILVVHGPEDALKREKIDQLAAALTEVHGELQVFNFDGKTSSLADVFDELRGYSLMGGYKLVIVDPAEDFVKTHREALERYAAQPVDHATLVLRAGQWYPGNLDKLIKKVGLIEKCEPPKPAEAVARLMERAQALHGLTFERPAAQLLVDRLGAQLVRLETETDKLAAMAGDSRTITRSMVESAVGRSSDEKAWKVQEIILEALSQAGPSARGGPQPAGIMIEKVRDLTDVGGLNEIAVLWSVTDLMRKLNIAGQMLAGGESEGSIAKAMRLWGAQTRLFMTVLRKISREDAAAMLDLALTADARSKSGFGVAGRNLEGLCVNLADVAG